MTIHQQMPPVTVARAPTSAVVGLVLAFLFWPAGLLLSRQALKHSRRRGGSGAGLALAGVAISVLVGLATVLLLAASAVGAARSGPVRTDGQSAACQLEVRSANRALQSYRSAGEAPLGGAASERLAALHGAGYIAGLPNIPGLALDGSGDFTGAC